MERLTKKSIARENGYVVDNPTVERCAKAIDKLGEYEDAEESGLLVRLPCKVGDTVYVLDETRFILTGPNRGWEYKIEKIKFKYRSLEQYDKFYLTREEAEQALKERDSK